MRSFNRGGGRSFGRRDFGGRGDRPMFKTVCSNCGNECEVPFRPTTGKPVYCSNCFEKVGSGRGGSVRSESPSFQAPVFDQNKGQFEALNTKLDKILSLLEPKVSDTVVPTPAPAKIKSPKAKKASSVKKKL